MTTKKRNLLRLKSLRFVSLVDQAANEHSTFVVKRAGDADELSATCRIVKIDETLGLLIGFANASSVGGEGYTDLQGDVTSEDELVKVCLEYAEAGAPVDEMHDEQQVDGAKTVFLFPLTADLAKSLDLGDVNKTGILFGVKVPPNVIERARKGEINGFSIGGMGTREPLEKSADRAAIEAEVVAAKAKAEAEKAEDATWLEGQMTWLDGLAREFGDQYVREVAKSHVSREGFTVRCNFGQAWIDRNPTAVEKEIEKADALEGIMKSAEVSYAKALGEWNTELAAFEKANPGKNVIHFFETEKAAKLYARTDAAREARIDGPVARYCKAVNEEIATLTEATNKACEDFAIQHNIDIGDTRERLTKISPSFKAITDRLGAAHDERRFLTNKARHDAALWHEQTARNATEAAEAETKKRLDDRRRKQMTPAERRLEDLAHKRAGDAGVSVSKAMGELLETELGRELYTLAGQERQQRQRGGA